MARPKRAARPRRQPLIKRYLRYPLEAVGLYVGLLLFRALSVDGASNLGGWLGRTIGPRLGISRRARRHIRFALPEKSAAEVEAILVGMWDNLGRVAGEYPHLRRITDPSEGRVELVGLDHAEFAPGAEAAMIWVSGHLANWEVLSAVGNRRVAMTSVAREPNNPWVRRILENLRGVWGGERLPKGPGAAKGIVAALRRGDVFAALIDQKMNDGIAVPFFGHEAMTTPAVALLALRHRCPICPFRIERLGPARFRLTSQEPLHPNPSGDHKADVLALMTTLNGILEEWIRARPAEWLWLHRRWSPRVLAGEAADRRDAVTEM